MNYSTKLKKTTFLLLLVLSSMVSKAQCVECNPDNTCGTGGDFPAVCPMQVPDGTVGEYYEQTLTFYMPPVITDPESQLQAELISVTIASVSGLPFGLTYTLNDEDGVYHPGEGQVYGCATICGTPILPGVYNINIAVTGSLIAFGLPITQSESFPTSMNVIPGEGTAGSFVYDQPAGCGSVEVNFNASIVAPSPAVTTYEWDFGNGQSSTLPNPSTVVYDTEGDYTTTLTTTVSEYKLQSVELLNVASGWDADEDIFGSPDPYFTLINGSGSIVYTSDAIDNTSSHTWEELDLLLDNPPYSLQFFDEDPISSDDNLGIAEISIGTATFTSGNGTVGNVVIALDTTNQVTDEAIITVFPFPDADFIANGNILVCNDQDLLNYTWHRNGVMIPDAIEPSYTMTQGGQYYCEVQNEFGCVAVSQTYLYCPAVEITYDAGAMEMEVANIYSSYQWYFNGLPIDGATTYYTSVLQSGNYAVSVTTNYGCTTMSEVYTAVVGMEEKGALEYAIYPNPVVDFMTIKCEEKLGPTKLRIIDISGKIILDEQINFVSTTMQIDLTNIPSGVYNLSFNGRNTVIVKE